MPNCDRHVEIAANFLIHFNYIALRQKVRIQYVSKFLVQSKYLFVLAIGVLLFWNSNGEGLMKRVILGMMVSGFALSSSIANAAGYGMAGCGIGAIVFGKQKGIIQVVAATLNGTSGSQTFGISTGTSNCAGSSESAALQSQQDFIANNLAPLSKEMAQGQGETLSALTQTLGCSAEVTSVAHSQLQKSHSKIFAAPGAYAVLESVKTELRAVPATATGCSLVAI